MAHPLLPQHEGSIGVARAGDGNAMTDTLKDRIASLSDEQLSRILTIDSGQYREEALEFARAEAGRRNLSPASTASDKESSASDLGDALRAFVEGVASQFRAARFTAGGKRLACSHCSHDLFEERSAVVNTRGLTLVGLDWLDKGATVLVCTGCGLLHWFRSCPERVRD